MGARRIHELHEEGDEEQDRLGVDQADDEGATEGRSSEPARAADGAPSSGSASRRVRHMPHAARSMPTASHVR